MGREGGDEDLQPPLCLVHFSTHCVGSCLALCQLTGCLLQPALRLGNLLGQDLQLLLALSLQIHRCFSECDICSEADPLAL